MPWCCICDVFHLLNCCRSHGVRPPHHCNTPRLAPLGTLLLLLLMLLLLLLMLLLLMMMLLLLLLSQVCTTQ